MGQLEAARSHGRQARADRAGGGLQPVAPVVVVFGRLRQFLVDHVVVNDLVTRGLDKVLCRRDVQRRRQVVRIEALVLQLLVQRLHLRAHTRRGTGRLRLEQPRSNSPVMPASVNNAFTSSLPSAVWFSRSIC
ncbi:hypothetical protein G6F68_019148 [Rhizopus microsporus]|nr:hypothetical protein G6F68_019148 [Rhizopus microsporus]